MSGMERTLPAAPRSSANALSRRPSQPPTFPKRAAWAAGTPRATIRGAAAEIRIAGASTTSLAKSRGRKTMAASPVCFVSGG